MSEPITTTYQPAAKATLEAMFTSGSWIMGSWWWLQALFGAVMTVLIGLGGGALVIAIGVVATGRSDAGLAYVWIGALGAGALFIAGQNLPPRRIARHIVQSPYSQGAQTAIFDEIGLTITNAQSSWQTNWTAVENIKLGKHGILVHVAGIAFAIPASDIANLADVFAQLQHWKQAA